AVDRGAVQPLFQRQVVDSRRTVLLQTAPGHATRCVPSPFTEDYSSVKKRLRAEGVPNRQMWEELERLNVGPLRIASKGSEGGADGARQSVDEERQLKVGMFMAGEVAVLRSATTTIAALHHSVSTGAVDFLTERRTALHRDPATAPAAEQEQRPEAPAP